MVEDVKTTPEEFSFRDCNGYILAYSESVE